MPGHYSRKTYETAVNKVLTEGKSSRQAARELGVNRSVVKGALERFAEGRPLVPTNQGKMYRHRLLNVRELLILFDIYESNETLYLDEAQLRLEAQIGKTVSISTLHRGLVKLHLTRKSLIKRAREASFDLQRAFCWLCRTHFTWQQFVWFDESAVDNRTPQRSLGRSPKGFRTNSKYVKFRGQRYSMVPAMSACGLLAWYIQERGINGQDLCTFAARCLVPYLRPFPQRHSVLICDNASTHHTQPFVDMIRATGALIVFLPPYSPELNPAELVFAKAKSWLRRHVRRVSEMNPFDAMNAALSDVTPQDCLGFIRKCGEQYCMG